MSTNNLGFEKNYEKYQNFFLKFSFFGGKFFSIFEQACFVMISTGMFVHVVAHVKLDTYAVTFYVIF